MIQQQTIVLEPTTQFFVDALAKQGGKPIYQLPYAAARKVLEDAQALPVQKMEAEIQELSFNAGASGHVDLRIYRPPQASGKLPAVMYFHGGGWVLGSKNTHDRLLRELCNGAQAAFVFVSYTPSPEAQFPVPLEQAFAATKYIAEQGASLGLDNSRLAVMGDSVGGHMTIAVTLLAKQRGGPQFRQQVLLYPVTDGSMSTESYKDFADGPWLTKAAMAWFWDAFAPKKEDRQHIMASPIRARVEDLKGLPPALVIVDENDVLRDEGEEYARKLMQAGVEVTAMRLLGTVHDFAMLNALAGTPAARATVRISSEKLAAALK